MYNRLCVIGIILMFFLGLGKAQAFLTASTGVLSVDATNEMLRLSSMAMAGAATSGTLSVGVSGAAAVAGPQGLIIGLGVSLIGAAIVMIVFDHFSSDIYGPKNGNFFAFNREQLVEPAINHFFQIKDDFMDYFNLGTPSEEVFEFHEYFKDLSGEEVSMEQLGIFLVNLEEEMVLNEIISQL